MARKQKYNTHTCVHCLCKPLSPLCAHVSPHVRHIFFFMYRTLSAPPLFARVLLSTRFTPPPPSASFPRFILALSVCVCVPLFTHTLYSNIFYFAFSFIFLILSQTHKQEKRHFYTTLSSPILFRLSFILISIHISSRPIVPYPSFLIYATFYIHRLSGCSFLPYHSYDSLTY